MTNKKVIAAVGMAGSGKTETITHLQKKYPWKNVYFGEATFDRIKKMGLEINYKNEKMVREDIRNELGMGAYAILALPKIEKILKTDDVVLVESLYSWEEYKILKEKFGDNFITISTFASPATRFERLTKRSKERPIKSMEEFNTRDYSEIENTDKGGPIARADYTIVNESNLKELHGEINIIINKILD
jgi:dephospho-CoA kinase